MIYETVCIWEPLSSDLYFQLYQSFGPNLLVSIVQQKYWKIFSSQNVQISQIKKDHEYFPTAWELKTPYWNRDLYFKIFEIKIFISIKTLGL